MGRPIVHWEFWSKDPGKVSDFYEKIFDWKIQHMPDMNYHFVDTDSEVGINGGIMKPEEGPWPGNMVFYIHVDDLEGYGKKVVDAGGEIIVDQMEVPGMGHMTLFKDPDGRVTGMWEEQEDDDE